MTQVTPNDILKTYPVFKVCTQNKPTDNVIYRDIRCPDLKELLLFMKRLLNPVKVEELSFFEVHQLHDDGKVSVLVGDANKPFPKTPTERIGGIISPKIPQPTTTRSMLPAIVPPAEPAPRKLELPKEACHAVAAIVKMKADKAKQKPDESGRLVKLYKAEVA